MLVFNEGVPRAGKSYDAVKNHILPALKKGRRVFARLNGLDAAAIARYLDLPLEHVESLLVQVDTKDVVRMFSCEIEPDSGKWLIPDHFKDALIVVDEVHEFYVNERRPLPDSVENFWALLGQNGGDAVIMTQWINRVHMAVRARIEKKNTFQKLTAVGLKSKYRVTYFHATSPGKFEKVGGATLAYDPKIYPLYHGYAPGSENTEVYEEGGTNVWRAMAVKAAGFLLVAGIGLYSLISFFANGGEDLNSNKPAQSVASDPIHTFDIDGNYTGTEKQLQPPAPVAGPQAVVDPFKDLTGEQRYVAELVDRGRVRLAARALIGDEEFAQVEWVNDQGITLEQLTLTDLRALGFTVESKSYGFKLTAGEHVIVATPWPKIVQVREPEHKLYNLSPRDGTGGIASAASETAGAGTNSGVVSYKAGERGDVFPRSPAYTPSETYTGPTTGL